MSIDQDLKPIIGIDTAFASVSVCILNTLDFEPMAVRVLELERGHAEALVPLISEVIKLAGLRFRDLGRVAVSVGPGSFTGVRVGLSAARAIGLAAGIEVVGVSTLSAFAAPFFGRESPVIASVIEARNGQIYFQGYTTNGATMIGPALGTVQEALLQLGPGPLWLAGTAALRVEREAAELDVSATCICQAFAPDVLDVARLGAVSSSLVFPPRPSYVTKNSY